DPHPPSLEAGQIACGLQPSPVNTFSTVDALLEGCELDAVVIATPNWTHAEVLDPIFERGLHVLVEKPMCTTLADCHAVSRRAENHPGVFWVGLEYRYLSPVAALLQALNQRAVGDLKMFSIREHRFPFLPKVDNWNRFNRNTGGTLVEKCCHFFDLMNLAIGSEAIRVMASGGQDVNHLDEQYHGETPDILDNAFVIVEYANGVRASLDLCMFAEGSRDEQEIVAVGDRGKLECTIPTGELIHATRSRADLSIETVPLDPRIAHTGLHHGASYLEHLDFLSCIQERRPARVGAREGLRSVEIGVAAHRSIEEGRVVDISELRD
ncbi:MAG: Gfo/Idh/MocA family oxidoreductase, partial [Myxococcota bacterium]|nr:Gfo/Idh/MocA family oxidoreductase [Myxococcota bacterium]